LIFDIIGLLLPVLLSPIGPSARGAPLELRKPILLIKQAMGSLLEQLLPVGLDDHTPGPFVLLSEFVLLLSV